MTSSFQEFMPKDNTPDSKAIQDLSAHMQTVLQQIESNFESTSNKISGRMDSMALSLDDLERNLGNKLLSINNPFMEDAGDLMTKAGLDAP